MSLSSSFPDTRPSLNLDFAKVKRLDPRITFTRASTATYYDGVTTAKAEENLLLQSQTFENASWLKSNVTISDNAGAAPDGTTTADLLYPSSSGSNRGFYQNNTSVYLSTAVAKAFSIYAKASGMSFIYLSDAANGAPRTWFNVSAGTVGTVAVNHTASIVDVGGGWYRCIVYTSIAWAANSAIAWSVSDADNSLTATASGTNGVLIWGAQLEQRSAVTAYTPTTTQPITNYIPVLLTAPAGTPRFDHNPVTDESLGFLVEEQRANIVNYSADFSNASWIKSSCTVSSNTIVAPDGTLTGDKIVEGSGTVPPYLAIGVTGSSAGVTYTMSCYAKAAERSLLTIFAAGGTNAGKTFNISNGTLGATIGSIVGSSITPVGNNWYRCSVTVSATAAITVRLYVGDGGPYAANGFSGIYVWGAQTEAGAFPTSYIATVASSVTRAADTASMTGTNFSEWYDASEGTFFSEIVPNTPTNNAAAQIVWDLTDGTANNRSRFFRTSTDGIGAFSVTTSGTVQVSSIGSGVFPQSVSGKSASTYKINDFAQANNAGTVVVDTSGTIPVVSQLAIGRVGHDNTFPLNGTIKKIAYYPKRLTNAQLQALTS